MQVLDNKAGSFGILGVSFFVISTLLAGFQFENYSHTSQLISESYAIDTPYGIYLRFFGFIPSGIFIFLFALYASIQVPSTRKSKLAFMLFGIFYGLATVIVSIFPCDAGCNKEFIDPSISQLIHNATGSLTYLMVPFSILFVGSELRKAGNYLFLSRLSLSAGIISLLLVLIFFSALNSPFIGLIQRFTEVSILIWILWVSFYLRRKHSF